MSDLEKFLRFVIEQIEVDTEELLEAFFLQEQMNGGRRDALRESLEEEDPWRTPDASA